VCMLLAACMPAARVCLQLGRVRPGRGCLKIFTQACKVGLQQRLAARCVNTYIVPAGPHSGHVWEGILLCPAVRRLRFGGHSRPRPLLPQSPQAHQLRGVRGRGASPWRMSCTSAGPSGLLGVAELGCGVRPLRRHRARQRPPPLGSGSAARPAAASHTVALTALAPLVAALQRRRGCPHCPGTFDCSSTAEALVIAASPTPSTWPCCMGAAPWMHAAALASAAASEETRSKACLSEAAWQRAALPGVSWGLP